MNHNIRPSVAGDSSALVEIVAISGLVGAVASLRDGRAHRRVVGRLFTGPRLLIRESLVRAQPGEPTPYDDFSIDGPHHRA